MVEVRLTFSSMDEMFAQLGALTVHNLAAGNVRVDETVPGDDPPAEKSGPDAAPHVEEEEKGDLDLDDDGKPWDPDLHASSRAKNADGTWRRKRGVKPDAPKEKPSEEAPSLAELRKAAEDLHTKRGMGVTRDVVGRFEKEDGGQCGKLSDLQEKDYSAFLAECKKETA